METLEHTFPIPETEAHKLDELREELPSLPTTYARDNKWMLLAISGVAGCLLGLLWHRKR